MVLKTRGAVRRLNDTLDGGTTDPAIKKKTSGLPLKREQAHTPPPPPPPVSPRRSLRKRKASPKGEDAMRDASPERKKRLTGPTLKKEMVAATTSDTLHLRRSSKVPILRAVRERDISNELSHLAPPFAKFWSALAPPPPTTSSTSTKTTPPPAQNPPQLYFGYGADLSIAYMEDRYPSAQFVSVGRLQDYRWMVDGTHGCATIIPSRGDVVFGMVYTMQDLDLDALQECKPGSEYAMQSLRVELQPNNLATPEKVGWGIGRAAAGMVDDGGEAAMVVALGYVGTGDGGRGEDHAEGGGGEVMCTEEEALRINRGILEALSEGMPDEYVGCVLRRYCPAPSRGALGIYW